MAPRFSSPCLHYAWASFFTNTEHSTPSVSDKRITSCDNWNSNRFYVLPEKSTFKSWQQMKARKLISQSKFRSLQLRHISTYVLWDLDVGEGVLGGLRWQGPGAEGRGHGSQTSGRHNFSLMEGGGGGMEDRNQSQYGEEKNSRQCFSVNLCNPSYQFRILKLSS